MPNAGYVPFTHYLVKAIGDISYPIDKAHLISAVDGVSIYTKPGKKVLLSDIFDMLIPDEFECATALYCAVSSTMEKNGI